MKFFREVVKLLAWDAVIASWGWQVGGFKEDSEFKVDAVCQNFEIFQDIIMIFMNFDENFSDYMSIFEISWD